MKKWLSIAVWASGVVILILAGGYSYFSPRITMWNIRNAAENRDKESLRDLIDFESVRSGLKDDFRAGMAISTSRNSKPNSFSPFDFALAGAIINPLIDTLVSPDTIVNIMSGRQVDSSPVSANSGLSLSKKPVRDSTNIVQGYDGFFRYRVLINSRGASAGEAFTLILSRSGLFSWRLSRLILPKAAMDFLSDDSQPPILSPAARENSALSDGQDQLPHALEGGNGSRRPLLVYSSPKLRAYIPEGIIKANVAYAYPNDASVLFTPIYIEFTDEKARQDVIDIIKKALSDRTVLSHGSGKVDLLKYAVREVSFNTEKDQAIVTQEAYIDRHGNFIGLRENMREVNDLSSYPFFREIATVFETFIREAKRDPKVIAEIEALRRAGRETGPSRRDSEEVKRLKREYDILNNAAMALDALNEPDPELAAKKSQAVIQDSLRRKRQDIEDAENANRNGR
jgi:hypothetical protein